MNRRFVLAAAVLVAVLFVPFALNAQSARHRVVFALTSSDEADWQLTVGNLRNLLAGFPHDSVDAEVVAYGPGLSFLKRGATSEQEIAALIAKHVRFVACENSMRAQHVTAIGLIQGVETVPSGVIEIVKKQEQGWSYIKAGR